MRLAIASALLLCAVPRASATSISNPIPEWIGTFTWEDVFDGDNLLIARNFSVTNDSLGKLQAFDFFDLFVNVTFKELDADGNPLTEPVPLLFYPPESTGVSNLLSTDQFGVASGSPLGSGEILTATLNLVLEPKYTPYLVDINDPNQTRLSVLTSATTASISVDLPGDAATPVPEPGSWVLLLTGIAALRARRMRRAASLTH